MTTPKLRYIAYCDRLCGYLQPDGSIKAESEGICFDSPEEGLEWIKENGIEEEFEFVGIRFYDKERVPKIARI